MAHTSLNATPTPASAVPTPALSGSLRVNDRLRLRERFAAFVMVGHDHVHAAALHGRFFQIRNAAVHRHDERDALFRQRIDGGGVEPYHRGCGRGCRARR